MSRDRIQILALLTSACSMFVFLMWLIFGPSIEVMKTPLYTKSWISDQITNQINQNIYPQTIQAEGQEPVEIEYGLDTEMQNLTDGLLKKYQPDYAGLVALNASTGRVLAMSSYNRSKFPKNFAVSATFPAASVFKLVTATAALDQNLATPDTILPYNGSSHTLYKRNVLKSELNRWTTYITMKEAFAHSVNTFFGRLGLYKVGTEGLAKYAERFQFNKVVLSDFGVESSIASIAKVQAEDLFSVAEAASGYNHHTTLSPVQGALMAASVVNDGIMMEPYLVKSLKSASGQVLYEAKPRMMSLTMKTETAEMVRELMRNTVERGTSHKAFRKLLRSHFQDADMGGKTGSLTCLQPRGRTDWFVGYLKYQDQKIAFAAVAVHEKLWRVRSSQLAAEFFSKYIGGVRLSQRQPANYK